MKPKYWILITLAAMAASVSLLWWTNQPAADLGPIVVHHEKTIAPSPTPDTSAITSRASSSPVSQTQVDTSGWKTYTNSQYGFSFEYPGNYKLTENNDPNAGFYILITTPRTQQIANDTGGEDGDAITIVPAAIQPGYFSGGILPSPIQFNENYFQSSSVSDSSNQYIGKLIVDGHTAFQLRHSEEASEKYTIFQNTDGSFLTVQQSFFASENDTLNTMEPYDTIISTFKFVK